MDFVACRIPIQLLQPELPSVCRRRAILASFVAMPEAAVDEDHGFVFWQDDVGADVKGDVGVSSFEFWVLGSQF